MGRGVRFMASAFLCLWSSSRLLAHTWSAQPSKNVDAVAQASRSSCAGCDATTSCSARVAKRVAAARRGPHRRIWEPCELRSEGHHCQHRTWSTPLRRSPKSWQDQSTSQQFFDFHYRHLHSMNWRLLATLHYSSKSGHDHLPLAY